MEGVYKALLKVLIILQNSMTLVYFKDEFNQAVKVLNSLGVKIVLPTNVLKKEEDKDPRGPTRKWHKRMRANICLH